MIISGYTQSYLISYKTFVVILYGDLYSLVITKDESLCYYLLYSVLLQILFVFVLRSLRHQHSLIRPSWTKIQNR